MSTLSRLINTPFLALALLPYPRNFKAKVIVMPNLMKWFISNRKLMVGIHEGYCVNDSTLTISPSQEVMDKMSPTGHDCIRQLVYLAENPIMSIRSCDHMKEFPPKNAYITMGKFGEIINFNCYFLRGDMSPTGHGDGHL